jgi:MFS family permease
MQAPPVTISQALDSASLTRQHWRIWFLSAMGVFLDGFDLFIVGVALPLIQREFNASVWQLGLVGAASPIGAIFGAVVLGRVTDRLGRKAVYFVDLLLFVTFAALSALAWNIESLIVFRFLLGVGIGADYPIGATYVSEFMPARVRGRMIVGAFSFQAAGAFAGAVVGLLLLLIVPEVSAWRWMLAAGIVPAIIVVVMRSTAPESPRWCEVHGKADEARRTVEELCGRPVVVDPAPAAPLPYSALFSRAFIRRTVLATVPWFLMGFALYGIGLFTPTILRVLGFTGTESTSVASFVSSDVRATVGAVVLDVFLVLGFLLAIWLIDRWGRIRLQLIGFAGMAVALLIAAAGASLTVDSTPYELLILGGFALFNLMVNMGPNPTTYTLPAELFPTSVRASGDGMAASAGKVGAAIGIFLVPVLKQDWGIRPTVLTVALICALGFAVTWFFRVETRGRSLEALADGAPPVTPSATVPASA